MPRAENINLKITAEVAVHKFFLREMLFFFIKRRNDVLFDSDFSFTAKDFSNYIEKMQFSTTIGVYINDIHIINNLKILKNDFFRRDNNLKVIEPKKKFLNFTKKGTGDDKIFTITNCQTEHINNAIRYLDISLMLTSEVDDKKRIDLELQRKIESINEQSLFGQTPEHKLIFCNKIADRPLGSKEKAVFNVLKRNFKSNVNYIEIYREISNPITGTILPQTQQKDYVNGGITELRKKLFEISGNPETITTATGRDSIYKLIY